MSVFLKSLFQTSLGPKSAIGTGENKREGMSRWLQQSDGRGRDRLRDVPKKCLHRRLHRMIIITAQNFQFDSCACKTQYNHPFMVSVHLYDQNMSFRVEFTRLCSWYYSYLDSSISETPIRKGRLYFGWHLCWHADGLLTLLRTNHSQHYVKVTWAMPQSVAHLEKLSLNFSISLFVIRVNLPHP